MEDSQNPFPQRLSVLREVRQTAQIYGYVERKLRTDISCTVYTDEPKLTGDIEVRS